MPELDHISNSMIETFIRCPKAFQMSYIDRVVKSTLPDFSFFPLGISVHGALEEFFRPGNEYDRTYDGLIMALNKYLEGVENPPSMIVFNEAKEILKTYSKTHSLIEDVIGVEVKIDDIYGGIPVKVIGYIDKMIKHDDYIEIVDYKTGKYPYTNEDLDNNTQSIIYAKYIHKLYPGKDILFTFDFVRFKNEYRRIFFNLSGNKVLNTNMILNEDDLDNRWNYIVSIAKNMIKSSKHDSHKFPANVNNLCTFCSVRDHCSKYKEFQIDNTAPTDIDGWIAEYNTMSNIERISKQEKGRAKDVILKYLNDGVMSNKYDVRTSYRRMKIRPKGTILKLLDNDTLINVVSINESALKKIDSDILDQIDAKTIVSNGKSYISKITKKVRE